MKTLVQLIKAFEGLRLRSYLCPARVWTIGYGSTGKDIGPGLVWTAEQAEARMLKDASGYLSAARRLCPALSGDRLEAVADFAYNLGIARLAGSTLRRRINAGDIIGASEEFEKWVFAGGIKLNGLKLRRHAEKMAFLK
jgi:GH24 family phage-related lysozyme (muramidase)